MITSPPDEPGARVKSGKTADQTVPDTEKTTSVPRAFVDLYDQEYLPIVKFVMRLGAALPDAEDAVQQAFTELWDSLEAQPETWEKISDPRAWVRVVARRKYRRPDENHRQPLPMPIAEIPEDSRPSGSPHEELTLGTLYVLDQMRKLDSLPQAVLAFHMDGFSAPEITRHLGLQHDQQARDLLKKARKTLARELARSRDQERRDG